MTPERWKQIEELFHAAQERGPAALADCDPELRREVEKLLAHSDEGNGRLLDQQAAALADDLAQTQIAVGSELGPYKIEAVLGAGGMGQVFRATDTRLGRRVAIKISHERFSDRFEREARSIAALNHPNICTLYDVGPNYLVMEFVEGETLAARLERGRLSLEQTLQYGAQIAAALAAAHSKGIIHRDLKPGNIMLAAEGAKVLDFGLAKSGQDATLTMGVMGTPAYMAPEQFEGKRCDARTDIYALGLVLFQMATGKPYVPGDRLATGVVTPPQLSHIVERCIAREPGDRWQNASDVRQELDWVERTTSAPPAAAAAGGKPRSRAWSVWVSVIANVVLAAAALIVLSLYFRPKPAAPAPVIRFEIPPPPGTILTWDLALSPDGRKLAFGARSGSTTQIWIHEMDSGKNYPLAGTEDARGAPGWAPIWSPDSRYLVFSSGTALNKIDAAGGPVRVIGSAPAAFERGFWTKDDKIIFSTAGRTGLLQVNASGASSGPPSAVTELANGETRHYSPALLPDGNHFLFLRVGPVTGPLDPAMTILPLGALNVGAMDAKPGQPSRHLLEGGAYAAFVPKGELGAQAKADTNEGFLLSIQRGTLTAQHFDVKRLQLTGDAVSIAEPVAFDAFSASNGVLVYLRQEAVDSVRHLEWLDRAGRPDGSVGEFGNFATQPTLSPDDKRVAYSRPDLMAGEAHLWILEFERGVTTQLTFGSGMSTSPVWSPDGRSIAYFHARGGVPGIYRTASNLAGGEELLYKTADKEVAMTTSWSRDGRYLLYQNLTTRGIFALPMQAPASGERVPIPVVSAELTPRDAMFSPDGRFISYIAMESNTDEVFVQSFDAASPARSRNAGGKWKISQGGAFSARWTADGKQIVYLARNGDMMTVDVSTSPVFHSSAPRRLFSRPDAPNYWDMTADGQRFLFPLNVEANTPYSVVLNWPSLLHK